MDRWVAQPRTLLILAVVRAGLVHSSQRRHPGSRRLDSSSASGVRGGALRSLRQAPRGRWRSGLGEIGHPAPKA
jgi:hypothetical protein